MILTRELLAAAVPRANVQQWLDPINTALDEFSISDPRDIAAFLATCAHESTNFTQLVENLNYGAQGLSNTWERYSSTGKRGGLPNALAKRLERRPEAIANNVYANRLGNGNEASGDGWRYRGRGIIQLTGRANYTDAARALVIDIVTRPDLVEEPRNAARTAGYWWSRNGASRHGAAGDMLAVSRLVNIGNANSTATPHGWNDRRERYDLALVSLTGVV
ncbi:glycoside hydrolase family 19 protein [Paraburkholderia susongensis]|uniref:Putative chitinase n=1 Tax=Paraburkholderia susongensis TaxID=1515439 RepID=A0A1X7I4L6_9BURK|nr:glycoside hydrolase family 19 protein [Paraburkholderia susongensis]SMG09142.1 putative chitinase [Paraburkholderia susongensis]